MSFADWELLHQEGLQQGRQGVVSALILRPGQVFAQRRSLTRRLFPGCWDLVGGHVEPGESLEAALQRELAEETGWTLEKVLGLHKFADWESQDSEGRVTQKREFVLVLTVTTPWVPPVLEAAKATEGRWFGPEELPLLNENRQGQDSWVYDLYRELLASPLYRQHQKDSGDS